MNLIEWLSNNNTQVLDIKIGDVNGDKIIDTVYLTGKKSEYPESPFLRDISFIVVDGKTNMMYIEDLSNNVSGYNPQLLLQPFVDKNIDDIFISVDSGGSGGYTYNYLYSFLNNQAASLFNVEKFNKDSKYQVNYEDQYMVKIVNLNSDKLFIIDISHKDPEYLKQLYNMNGQLKTITEGEVIDLNNLYSIDFNNDGIFDLCAVNRVIGLYNADTLGYIITPLSFQNNEFKTINNMQYVSILGTDISNTE